MASAKTRPSTNKVERKFDVAKDESLGNTLIKLGRLLQEHTVQELRNRGFSGIRMSHSACLPHIDLEGTRISTLAERMEITSQGAGKLVRELESLGYAERFEDPTDRRATVVRITSRGFEAMLCALKILAALESRLAERAGKRGLTELRKHAETSIALLTNGRPT